MSNRYIFCRPSSQRKNQKFATPKSSKLITPRQKLKSQIDDMNMSELFINSKSPVANLRKQSSFFLTRKKSIHSPLTSALPISTRLHKLKKKARISTQDKIQKTKNLSMGFSSSRRPENFRYSDKTLEENESYKNLNGVSTPPEEDPVRNRCTSPFSDIIDQDLSNYMNQQIPKLSKLELPKNSYGFIQDSYQYSTADSRKRDSSKFSFEKKVKTPEPPKAPPPYSIYSKMYSISSVRTVSKVHKFG